MKLTKEQYEYISRIFFPHDDYKLPFKSKWKHTRENIGKHIIEDDISLSFSLGKYFELHMYIMNHLLIKDLVVSGEEVSNKINTISIQGKVSDRCFVMLYDKDDNSLLEHSGYVPDWMPGGGGDDMQFQIDNETGKILNWEPIQDDVLENEEE